MSPESLIILAEPLLCCVRLYHRTCPHFTTSLFLQISGVEWLNAWVGRGENVKLRFASSYLAPPHTHTHTPRFRRLLLVIVGPRGALMNEVTPRGGMTGETKHQWNLSPQFSFSLYLSSFFSLYCCFSALSLLLFLDSPLHSPLIHSLRGCFINFAVRWKASGPSFSLRAPRNRRALIDVLYTHPPTHAHTLSHTLSHTLTHTLTHTHFTHKKHVTENRDFLSSSLISVLGSRAPAVSGL